jgi:hypothetical protein
MSVEVGDVFIIKNTFYWHKKPRTRCLNPNKKFRVVQHSKSKISVYYADTRTNNPCKCSNCHKNQSIKCIGIKDIEVVETNIQRERNIKLNQIL